MQSFKAGSPGSPTKSGPKATSASLRTPLSLHFIPSPNGVGGTLVPAVGKLPCSSSGSPRLTSLSIRNTQSCGDSASADKQTNKLAGAVVLGSAIGQLPDRQPGSLVLGSPVSKQAYTNAFPASQYILPSSHSASSSPLALASSNLAQQDSGMSETLLMKTGSFSGSSSSQATQAVLHAQQAASPMHSSATQQLGGLNSPSSLLQHLIQTSPTVQPGAMLSQQAQLGSLGQYPFSMHATAAQPSVAFSAGLPGGYAVGIPMGVPFQQVVTAHPQAQTDSLAQLLAQHPQQCQPVPSNSYGPSIKFDLDQMALALDGQNPDLPSSLHSTNSNVSLASELMQPQQGHPPVPSSRGPCQSPDMMLSPNALNPFLHPLPSCKPLSQLDKDMLGMEFEGELNEHLSKDARIAIAFNSMQSPFNSVLAQDAAAACNAIADGPNNAHNTVSLPTSVACFVNSRALATSEYCTVHALNVALWSMRTDSVQWKSSFPLTNTDDTVYYGIHHNMHAVYMY